MGDALRMFYTLLGIRASSERANRRARTFDQPRNQPIIRNSIRHDLRSHWNVAFSKEQGIPLCDLGSRCISSAFRIAIVALPFALERCPPTILEQNSEIWRSTARNCSLESHATRT
jgi:hypothetical protein